MGQRTRSEKRAPDPTKGREPTPAKEKSTGLLKKKTARWISDGPRPDDECVDYVWPCGITKAEFGSPYKPDTNHRELRPWGMTETAVISANATFSNEEAQPVRLSSGWRSCCKCGEMSNPVTSQRELRCLNCTHRGLDCPKCVIFCWVKRRTARDDEDVADDAKLQARQKMKDWPNDSTKDWPNGSREYWPLATRAGRPLGPFNETPMWWKCAAPGCRKYGWFEEYDRFLLWGKRVEGSPRCCDGAELYGSPWVFNHFGVCLGKLDGSVVAIGGPWYWHILFHRCDKEAPDCTRRSHSHSPSWPRKHIPGFKMGTKPSKSTPIIPYCQETEETPSASNHEHPPSAPHSKTPRSRSSKGGRSEEDKSEYFGVSTEYSERNVTDEPIAPRTRTSTSQTFYEYYVPQPQYPLDLDPDAPFFEECHSWSAACCELADYLRSPEDFGSEYFRLMEYFESQEHPRSGVYFW